MTGREIDPSEILIGRARPGELPELSTLARRAKAHWGYRAEWLAEWSPQLTITMEILRDHDVFVARAAGDRILGFHAVAFDCGIASLEHLWVHPDSMGLGVGRLLFRHAEERARLRGCGQLQIDSDPNAESFYLRMGALRVGTIEAPVTGAPDRTLPRLRLRLRGRGRGSRSENTPPAGV